MSPRQTSKVVAPPVIRPAELTVIKGLLDRFEDALLAVPDHRTALVVHHLINALLAAGDLQNEGVKNND